MTARIYFNTSAASNIYVEVDARMRLMDWEVREQAEEGSAAMSTVTFDDPDMDWDVTPWRGWYMVEDASTASNSVICGGWIADQEIGREGGDRENPLARVWSVSLTDANAYWQMRVMVGADANRPAETDVERMQWLLATNEVAWAYDTTTYVQTTTPIAMDACDYRGQYLNQIMDDCAQASGRNWYTWIDLVGGVRKVMVWYGHDDWAVYDSPLSLTNDPADFTESEITDGTSLVWLISPDTKLHRDPSRMYDGVYLQYSNGAIYRDTDPRTVRRDFISPSSNVKSQAKAVARALRYLADLEEQDEVITTSVDLPAAKATMIRAGMRLMFKATHLPGYADFRWCRVLSCSVTPIAHGERYRLTLELVPVGVVVPTVKWITYGEDGETYGGGESAGDIAIEASDNGTDWVTVVTKAQLVAGTVNPPNVAAGTYDGIVEISTENWSHRYWRVWYSHDHTSGYYPGISVTAFRLLSEPDYDGVCRLGTPSAGVSNWWEIGLRTWTGDIAYTGTCNRALMWDPDTLLPGTSADGRQGQGSFKLNPNVEPSGTITATWTFDLLEGA